MQIGTSSDAVAHRPLFVEQQKDVARTTAYAYCALPRWGKPISTQLYAFKRLVGIHS